MSGVVALLTDFGLSDGYVGVMKAVMLTRDPTLRLVDLTHEVPPQDIRRGAFVLRAAVPARRCRALHVQSPRDARPGRLGRVG